MKYNKYDEDKRVAVLSKYNNRCAYCGCKLTLKTLSVDHIEPLQRHIKEPKADKYDMDNLNPSCYSCNSSKQDKTIEVWREHILNTHTKLLKNDSSYRLLNRMKMISVKSTLLFYFEKINK